MRQYQEAFFRVEMVKQPQPVEQNQRFAAPGHSVDDVQAEIVGQRLPALGQIQIGLHRPFLVVI